MPGHQSVHFSETYWQINKKYIKNRYKNATIQRKLTRKQIFQQHFYSSIGYKSEFITKDKTWNYHHNILLKKKTNTVD